MDPAAPAAPFLGVSNGEKGDPRLDALIERMDRIANCVERSSVSIYQRRMITYDIGNPGEQRPCQRGAPRRFWP